MGRSSLSLSNIYCVSHMLSPTPPRHPPPRRRTELKHVAALTNPPMARSPLSLSNIYCVSPTPPRHPPPRRRTHLRMRPMESQRKSRAQSSERLGVSPSCARSLEESARLTSEKGVGLQVRIMKCQGTTVLELVALKYLCWRVCRK
jgi:hypothetical protein